MVFPPLKKKIREGAELFPEGLNPHKLNPEQEAVRAAVSKIEGFGVHLLYGVTGSGKTEVYMSLFEEVFKKGQQGMFLIPEISLTPQLSKRFSERFPGKVSRYHSQLTDRTKTNYWWDFYEQKTSLMLGARSALFCPSQNLGLIVVDEEHEPSFKQDEKLKYHVRSAATVLGKLLDIPVVLGSATPSLESWQNVNSGKYHMHKMLSLIHI